MENPYLGILWSALGDAAPAVPYAIGILALMFVLNALGSTAAPRKKRNWQRREDRWRYRPSYAPIPATSRMPDPADQLRIVMASKFRPKRFLNRGESRVFAALEPILTELAPGWRVMAQVSLGEVLESDSVEGFNTINAKRVDFLLLDPKMRPRHAIEYQGQGHHQGPAAARDAVKKEALRRAGIGFVEVHPDDTPAELRRVVERLVASN